MDDPTQARVEHATKLRRDIKAALIQRKRAQLSWADPAPGSVGPELCKSLANFNPVLIDSSVLMVSCYCFYLE